MNKILIFLLIINFSFTIAQEKKFKNQGEQENYWAEQVFEKQYQKQKFPKYKGKIIVLSNQKIKFENKTLELNIFDYYLPIFKNGIFYPQLILGNTDNNRILTENELEKATDEERIFNQIGRNDLFRISNLEELTFLNKDPKIKRFRFWSYTPGMVNPTVYYFEITNEKANKDSNLQEFSKNAKLTFLKKGGLIL